MIHSSVKIPFLWKCFLYTGFSLCKFIWEEFGIFRTIFYELFIDRRRRFLKEKASSFIYELLANRKGSKERI